MSYRILWWDARDAWFCNVYIYDYYIKFRSVEKKPYLRSITQKLRDPGMLLRNFPRQRKGTGFNRGGKNKNRSNSKSLSRRWAPKLRNVYVYRLPNRSGRHPRPTSRDDLINARLIVIYPDYHNRVYKPSHRLIIINLPCRRKRHGIIATVALLINARFVLEEEEEGGVAAAGDEVARHGGSLIYSRSVICQSCWWRLLREEGVASDH